MISSCSPPSRVLRVPAFLDPVLEGYRRTPGPSRSIEARDAGSAVVLGAPSALRIAEVLAPCVSAYGGSVIVFDPTGELYRTTLAARTEAYGADSVFRYAPLVAGSDRFDALAGVRIGSEHEVMDALDVARVVCDAHGMAIAGLTDSGGSWRKLAQAFLVSVILHVLHDPRREPDLSGVAELLAHYRSDSVGMLQDMISGVHDPDLRRGWLDVYGRPTAVHRAVAAGAQDLLDRLSRERASILSTLASLLAVHARAAVLSRRTARSFSFSDLVDGAGPCTLYLECSPDDVETVRPLFRTLLVTIISRRVSTTQAWPRSLLIAADAFTNLGPLSALSFLVGYGTSLLLGTDGVPCVEAAYPRHGSPLTDATAVVALGVRDSKTAEYVSQRLERRDVPWGSQGRRSRAQLTADEILSLPDDRIILFGSGCSTVIPARSAEPAVESESVVLSDGGSEVVAATSEGSVSVEEGVVVLRDTSGRTVVSWRSAEATAVARAVASLYVSGGLAVQVARFGRKDSA